ncbi:MAG: hypothetical protein J7K46_00620 [Bacteroidales bacterium]|nr:hypothetical protein [Bacteroidales bacterium]
MVKYNMKIIFANRFLWFLLVAFLVFILISIIAVLDNEGLDISFIYGSLLLPGVLLLFYPTVFGIQNDDDARVLEILFGIPDYRYKVWLVRLLITFLFLYIILVCFTWMGAVLVLPVPVFEMAGQLMFPLLFIGMLGFMLSTMIRSGTATAVVLVLLGVGLLILQGSIDRSMWNVFHNPYNVPRRMNEMLWARVTLKNRLFLVSGSILFLLYGLLNLQKREKFIK